MRVGHGGRPRTCARRPAPRLAGVSAASAGKRGPASRGAAPPAGRRRRRGGLELIADPRASCRGPPRWPSSRLQCSCLESPRDGRGWRATVYSAKREREKKKKTTSRNMHPLSKPILKATRPAFLTNSLFLPGEFQGQRSLAGYSPFWKENKNTSRNVHPLSKPILQATHPPFLTIACGWCVCVCVCARAHVCAGTQRGCIFRSVCSDLPEWTSSYAFLGW